MQAIGKILIFFGMTLAAAGIIFVLIDKIPWAGRLPGDIYIEKKNFSFYFPVATCILISVVISLFLILMGRR